MAVVDIRIELGLRGATILHITARVCARGSAIKKSENDEIAYPHLRL